MEGQEALIREKDGPETSPIAANGPRWPFDAGDAMSPLVVTWSLVIAAFSIARPGIFLS
jgi:hypothetical protein